MTSIEIEREKKKFAKTFKDQDVFVKAVLSNIYRFLFFAGNIRSGKTIVCLLILVMLCKIYPGSRWFVVRHSRPVLLKTTIPSFFKYCCPKNFVEDYNRQGLKVTMENESEINFISEAFKTDPDLDDFKGLEANGFLLEQVEELQEETFNMCVTRSGQWKIDPMPPPLILANCNPTNNWVKDKVYDKFIAGELKAPFYFQVADWNKNPHLTREYKELIKNTLPPEMYARYCENRWDAVDMIGQLVPWETIHDCKNLRETKSKHRYMGVDVGRDGPDPSVWLVLEDVNIIAIRRKAKTKMNEVREETKNIILEFGIDPEDVCIDAVGLGAGVCDDLEEEGFDVIQMKGGTPCKETMTGTSFRFANYRSWSHWLTREEMIAGRIGNLNDRKLISQAGSIKYIIKGDKEIYIQSKEEMKTKLKRSPDEWDSFTYAVWAKKQGDLVPKPGLFSLKDI